MRPFNKVFGIFRLGKDPEIKYTQNGKAVATFSGASESSYKSGDEWETTTEWTRFVFWGPAGERFCEYAQKGSLVYIEGRLQTRSWEDKNGDKKYVTEVIVAKGGVLSGFANSDGDDDDDRSSSRSNQKGSSNSKGSKSNKSSRNSRDDDDIPF